MVASDLIFGGRMAAMLAVSTAGWLVERIETAIGEETGALALVAVACGIVIDIVAAASLTRHRA
ncbi:MAG TPA: hypothetical protein VMT58_01965 [Candidatus Binataceae bacterium]|nr:hypothetical protein [Candidatus Binataceae bacterium]